MTLRRRLFSLGLATLLLLSATKALALTCNSVAGAVLWNTAANWSCGRVPTTADTVTISAGSTVSLNTNSASVISLDVIGVLNIGNAAATGTARTLSVAGDITVSGTLQVLTNATATHTLNAGGNLSNTGTVNLGVNGSNGRCNTTFNNTASQTITGPITFNLITINNTGAAGSNIVDFQGAMTVPTPFLTITRGIYKHSNTSNITPWTATPSIPANGGFWLASTATVSAAAGFTLNGGSLQIDSGTMNIGTVAGNSLTLNNNAATSLDVNGGTLNIAGGIVSSNTTGSGSFNQSGGTVTTCTVSPATALCFRLASNQTFTMSGGTLVVRNFTSGGNEFDLRSTSQTVTGGTVQIGDASTAAAGTFNVTNGAAGQINVWNFVVNTTTGPTAQLGRPLNVLNDLQIQSGATLNAASQAIGVGGNWDNSGTYTPGTQTVTFNGTAAQTITGSSATAFSSMTVSNTTAAVSATTNFSVASTFNMSGASTLFTPDSGVVISGAGTMTGSGTVQVTRATGTSDFSNQYTISGKTLTNLTVEYVGAAAQDISALAYGNLKINNANGLTMAGNATVSTLLTLASGVVTTGASTLAASGNCPGSVLWTPGSWVAGNLQLRTPAAGSVTCIFHIGGPTNYRPVTIQFNTLSAAGNVSAAVSQSAGDSPNIGTSTFDSSFTVNRYWTIANGSTFSSALATFTYVASDIDAGVDEGSLQAGRFSAGWSYLATSVTTSLSAQVSGITSATLTGQFALGEQAQALNLFSRWRMNETAWNGTAGEVADSGTGGTFNGTASGLSTPVPTTSSTSPAISGSPGTCRYGVFNRANKDYIALSSSYPHFGNSAGKFTAAAWIRTTDNSQAGQRIMLDDETNANGSWGFSLGDPGAGQLRFYYRPVGVVLDTGNVIASNTWYYVAVAVSFASKGNSTATIYVYNQAGALVASPSATFAWSSNTLSGASPSIGGETNASGENTAAFGFAGNIDEVRVYRNFLTAAQVNTARQETVTCAVLDHIRLEHSGSGVTCLASAVTVKACADAACSTLYTDSTVDVTLSSTAGTFSTNPVSITTGSVNVALSVSTPQTVTLGAPTVSPAPVSGVDCFNGTTTNNTTACQLTFADTGFIFSSSAGGGVATVGTQTSGTSSSTLYLRAVKKSTTTQSCESALQGANTVSFAYECNDPATCSGSDLMSIDGGTPTTIARNNNGSVGSFTSVNMTFDANGNAPFTLDFLDVGKVSLHTTKTVATGATLTGASNSFVVKPADFAISNIQTTAGALANPAAADANGAKFAKAGEAITLTVTARNSLGSATPNFGKESTPQGPTLSQALVGGLGLANTGSLSNATVAGGAFVNGAATVTNVSWSEVGIITLSANLSDYLASGSGVTGVTTGNVGRFYPDHFSVSAAGTLTPGCSTGAAFTYLGQPFSLSGITVQAQNAANGITGNYSGGFAKHVPGGAIGANWTFGARDTTGAGTALTVDTSAASETGSWSGGSLTAGFSAIAIDRPAAAPGGPFASTMIGIAPADSDGVATTGLDFSTTGGSNDRKQVGSTSLMRYGRLRVLPAAGPTNVNLRVPLRAEYWNGTAFVTNSDDCTTLLPANVGLSLYQRNLSSGDTSVVSASLSNGLGVIVLAKPPAGPPGHEGSVLVKPDLAGAGLSYLRGAWDGTATYTVDPSARAAFGVYGAQPQQFIFQRENY